jgi:hypothetical protein
MKKSQIEKLKQTLSIFSGVFVNKAELQRIEIELGTGKNIYKSEILNLESNTDGLYELKLVGKTLKIDPVDLVEVLANEASPYDKVVISIFFADSGRRIEADDKNVKVTNIIDAADSKNNASGSDKLGFGEINHGVSVKRDYYIRVDEARTLLNAIGILDENGKVRNNKIRKYNQIDRFVEIIDPIIRGLIERKAKVLILDLACGKSYLSFVLNYYIREKLSYPCEFIGLDRMDEAIDASVALAAKLKYSNMTFTKIDLEKYEHAKEAPALCISLHACDTATDYGIFTAIKSGSRSIICVPCCQKELLTSDFSFDELDGNILKHGLLKERFSSLLTDSMRLLLMEACGYKTSIMEYISPLDSPKNILIKGIKVGSINRKSLDEYHRLKDQHKCDITLGKLLKTSGII